MLGFFKFLLEFLNLSIIQIWRFILKLSTYKRCRKVKKWIRYKKSRNQRLFCKIINLVPVLFHFRYYLMNSITEKHNAVQHQDRPKHVYLESLEACTDDSHQKYEGYPLPHLDLAHWSYKRFLCICYHLIEQHCLLIFRHIFFRLFFHKPLGSKVTDNQL